MKHLWLVFAVLAVMACNDTVSTTAADPQDGTPGDIDGSRETNGSASNESYVHDESGKIFLKYYYESMHVSYKMTSSMAGMPAGTKDIYWNKYGWNELRVENDTVNNKTSYTLINGDMGYFWDEGKPSYYKQQSYIAPYYYTTKPTTQQLEEDALKILEGFGYSYEKDTVIIGIPCEKYSGALGSNTIWRRGMQSMALSVMDISEEYAIAVDSTSTIDSTLFEIPADLKLQEIPFK